MPSSRNAPIERAAGPSAERILDAAASCVRRSGSHRVAISAVARAAGLSRPTVYRYFPDGDALVRALWQRELTRLVSDVPAEPADRAAFVARIVAIADAVSLDETLAPTFAAEPSLMTRYIVERLGEGQRAVRERLRAGVASLQVAGGVRPGDPDELATMTLLIIQSAIQSRRMVADALPAASWRRELGHAVDGYLAPKTPTAPKVPTTPGPQSPQSPRSPRSPRSAAPGSSRR